MEIQTIQELHQAFAVYQKRVEKLLPIAREQQNENALALLRSTLFRLKQGPIRTLVMGVSSAGKSTLINAMAGSIVVPEGKRTVSPIPVWVYNKNASSTPTVKILKEENGIFQSNNCGRFKFLTDYCYTAAQAGQGTGQEKYRNVVAATVNVNSEALADAGITLIDTPGIGVSTGDNARVQEILRNGCEMLIIQFWNLQEEDVKEYFRNLLVEEDAPLRTLLEENRVFLALNSSKTVFHHALLDTQKHIYDAFDGWEAEGRLFAMNVLDERIRSCGIYEYTDYLTEPYSPEEWTHAEESREIEVQRQEMLDQQTDQNRVPVMKSLQDQIGLDKLCASLGYAVEELCEDADAVEEILKPIRENILCAISLLEKPIRNEIERVKMKEYSVSETLTAVIEKMEAYYQELLRLHDSVQGKLDLGAEYSRTQWPLENLQSVQIPDVGTLLCEDPAVAESFLQNAIRKDNAPYNLVVRITNRMTDYKLKLFPNLDDPSLNPELKYWKDFFQGMTNKLFEKDPLSNALLEEQKVHLFSADISRTFDRAQRAGRDAFYMSDAFELSGEKKQDLITYLTKKREKIMAGGLGSRWTDFWLYINLKVDKLSPMVHTACVEARKAYMQAYRRELWGYTHGLYQDFRILMMEACVGVARRLSVLKQEMQNQIDAKRKEELDKLENSLQQLRDLLHE